MSKTSSAAMLAIASMAMLGAGIDDRRIYRETSPAGSGRKGKDRADKKRKAQKSYMKADQRWEEYERAFEIKRAVLAGRHSVEPPKLSYCPFCGGAAEFRIGGNWNPKLGKRVGVGVRCKDCGAGTAVRQRGAGIIEGMAESLAADLWNRRVEE